MITVIFLGAVVTAAEIVNRFIVPPQFCSMAPWSSCDPSAQFLAPGSEPPKIQRAAVRKFDGLGVSFFLIWF